MHKHLAYGIVPVISVPRMAVSATGALKLTSTIPEINGKTVEVDCSNVSNISSSFVYTLAFDLIRLYKAKSVVFVGGPPDTERHVRKALSQVHAHESQMRWEPWGKFQ